MITITIHNKLYKVLEAKTEEELTKGLKGIKLLPEDEGMLFYLSDESSQEVFTMRGVEIPLDIIFINLDLEVVDVKENCQPGQKYVVSSIENLDDEDYIAYVLEVNPNSNILIGDDIELEEDNESLPVMKVLFPDGSELMALWGGERIVSRRETKILIKKAKKADKSNLDSDYKALGKYIFKVFNNQDNRNPEYVQSPS